MPTYYLHFVFDSALTLSFVSAESKEVGYCTHLEWISPRASAFSQLMILAASFQGALTMYHVALPKVKDKKGVYRDPKPPTATTQLSQTFTIKPFGLARWPAVHHRAFVSFCDLGPHTPPTAAVLLTGLDTNLDYARLALVTCQLPMYGTPEKNTMAPLQVWDTQICTKSHLPRGLVSCTYLPGFLYFSDNALHLVKFDNLPNRGGFGSLSVGLTTSGTNYWGDAIDDKSGVLSVYTTYHCERRKASEDVWEWSEPTRRHWLIQTFLGDCKESMEDNANNKEEKEDEVVTGGTSSTAVCELGGVGPLYKLVPYRVVRNLSGSHLAVWFHSFGGDEDNMIAMLEEKDGKYSIAQFMNGREVVFLPNQASEDSATPFSQALVVSRNGGAISLWQRKFNATTKTNWQQSIGMACRPILGVDQDNKDDGYIECLQLGLTRSIDQVGLLAAGLKGNGLCCIIAGKLQPAEGLVWSNLLPNVKEDPVLWLEENEQVSFLISLPCEQAIRGGIAVATNQRVMILSPELKILAQILQSLPPSTLVPMGSYTVAYCSHDDYKIRYLSGLPDSFGCSGIISALPPTPQHSYCPHWLIAIRPDRLIYTSWHCGTRLVERGQSSNTILLPTAITRPALLLEPMIANAIATKKDGTQTFFRTVVEKFGRKVATMTHGEDEGIGNWGAGMTPRVFELLNQYNLKAAASWLLTGTTHFDRSANSRLLPSFMPVSAKIKAAIDTDTHLHVIANGDQYFSEYVKSPDNNMSATLPRPSDPSAFYCHQFAIDAIKDGHALDSLKMLDIAGTESSDAMLLQLSLAMQMDPFKDVTPVLESLCQHDGQAGKSSGSTTAASLAALALELKKRKTTEGIFTKRWMKPLAPSFQRGKRTGRLRPRIIGETAFSRIGKTEQTRNKLFSTETSESKHVW